MNIAIVSALMLGCADAGLSLGAASPSVSPSPSEAAPAPIVLAAAQADALETPEAAPTDSQAAEEVVAQPEQAAGGNVFAGESDDAVVARIVDYIEGLDTLQGDFHQVAPSGAMSSGKFYLRRPGLLRFEYEPPTPLLIVANGGMVFVRDDSLETTDSYPVNKTPLKFLLGRTVDLDDARVQAVDRGADSVAVRLASTDEETEGDITLIFRAPDLALEQWAVRDVQEGLTVVTLEDVETGGSIANRLFRVPETGSSFLKN